MFLRTGKEDIFKCFIRYQEFTSIGLPFFESLRRKITFFKLDFHEGDMFHPKEELH